MVGAVPSLPDVNHPPGDHLLAEDANALIIQRMPFAMSIGGLKRHQFIIQAYVLVHSV